MSNSTCSLPASELAIRSIGLAKDIAALSLIIQVWVEANRGDGSNDFGELLRNTGLIQ
jgi:hypothetical protein